MFDDILGRKKHPKGKICPYCDSKKIEKNGNAQKSAYGWLVYMTEQPMKCNTCDRTWILVYDWRQVVIDVKTTL